MTRAAAFALTSAALLGVVLDPSPAQSRAAAGGRVSARLVYRVPQVDHHYAVRLTIDRSGRRVFNERVPSLGPTYVTRPQGLHGRKALTLVDLDRDGEPELLLDFYSGGAHCCVWSRIYRWAAARRTYVSRARLWGNVEYRLTDLDHDGTPELLSADDRFSYAFTSYAASSDPLQIWTYRSGRLVETTQAFPSLVARDALRQWRLYRAARRERWDIRGPLAAWTADECLVGRGASAFATLEHLPHAVWRTSSVPAVRTRDAYVARLRRFLARIGYDC